MIPAHLARSAESPEEILALIEERKCIHLDTKQACSNASFFFRPLVVEAHAGGMHSVFRKTIDWIAQASAAAGVDKESQTSLRIAQRIGCSLQKEDARAVLRRFANPALSRTGVSATAAEMVDWKDAGCEPVISLIAAPMGAVMPARDVRMRQSAEEDDL